MVTNTRGNNPDLGQVMAAMPLSPDMRLALVRNYASSVFGKETIAAAWMGRVNAAIGGGNATVAEACQSEQGFTDAMLELHRLHGSGDIA